MADTNIDIKFTYGELTDDFGKPTISPVNIFRKPNEKDYKKGYFKRFFIARYDSHEAIETDFKFFSSKFSDLPKGLYKKASMNWYITRTNLPHVNKMTAITVKSVNEYYCNLASKKLPQIKNTIKDFAKFVR